jgi:hypothetical protein
MKDYINKRIEGRNIILESSSIVMEFFGKKKKIGPRGIKKYDDKEVKGKIKIILADVKKILKDYKIPELRLCGNSDVYGSYDSNQEYFESGDDFNIIRCDIENDEEEKELKKLMRDIEKIVEKHNIFIVSIEHDKTESFIYLELKFVNEL